jgi:acetyl-CoA C-acetyltransferase
MAKVRAMAIAGNEPILMGIGPVHAMRKLLSKNAVNMGDIGHIEVNEAFASQTISVIREMNWNTDMVNPLGGALALGHPLGATGARILTTMVHSMQRNNTRYGLASMCIGGGQGIATLLELVN